MVKLTEFEREQMMRMKDGETVWSSAKGWPGIRDSLECKGLIRSVNSDNWMRRTVLTDEGITLRAQLRTDEDAKLLADGNAWYSQTQLDEIGR